MGNGTRYMTGIYLANGTRTLTKKPHTPTGILQYSSISIHRTEGLLQIHKFARDRNQPPPPHTHKHAPRICIFGRICICAVRSSTSHLPQIRIHAMNRVRATSKINHHRRHGCILLCADSVLWKSSFSGWTPTYFGAYLLSWLFGLTFESSIR